jgi:hypothetical protein
MSDDTNTCSVCGSAFSIGTEDMCRECWEKHEFGGDEE